MTVPVNATQCISCGHVAAPARQLYQCDLCSSFDLRIFEAEAEQDIVELEAPRLPRRAAEKLLAAIRAEERFTLTELGEGAIETDLF